MKTNLFPAIARPVTLASLALAALTLATAAHAQSQAVGDDGIAASPKVRQMLHERKASTNPTVVTAPAMTCPKCADVLVTGVNRPAKGAELMVGATKTVVKHTCAACETRLAVVGEGKAKHTVASHKCTADVPNPATCCAAN